MVILKRKKEVLPREMEVVAQVASGVSYSKYCRKFFLPTSKLRKHVENICIIVQVDSKYKAVLKR
jgi:DNA-binding CsgD family transcriptional regulator